MATVQSKLNRSASFSSPDAAALLASTFIDSFGRSRRSSAFGSSARMPSRRMIGSVSNRNAGSACGVSAIGAAAPALT